MPKTIPTYHDSNGTRQPDANARIAHAIKTGELRSAILARNQYYGRRLPPKLLPGLNTVGYVDAEMSQESGSGWHYNEGLEVTVVANGQLPFEAQERACDLRPGMAVATAPWLRHRVGVPQIGPCRSCWFMLDVGVRRTGQPWKWPRWICLTPSDLEELQVRIETAGHYVWQADALLCNFFVRLAEAVRTDREGSNCSLIGCLVNESLLLLLAALRNERGPYNGQGQGGMETVAAFWERLRASPEDLAQPWTLHKMAKRCGLGQTRFVFCTKQLENQTPLHYLNRCRLERAARCLLEQPDRSVTMIGMDCGFSSGQWFAQKFKQHFGCAPQVYRAAKRPVPPAADDP